MSNPSTPLDAVRPASVRLETCYCSHASLVQTRREEIAEGAQRNLPPLL
jgi:hypothetical protein